MMGRRAGSGAVMAALVAAVLTGATASSGATGSVELYVSDVAGGTIERVDPSAGTVGPGIPVPQGPFDIDITPNGRTAYTVSGFSNAVVPVDLGTSTVDAAIPLTCGTQMAIVPGRQKAYVTQGCGTTVTPLDLFTNTLGMPIEVGTRPFGIAVTADGGTAYVATGGNTTTSPNALVPIDVDTDTAGSPIPLGQGGGAIGVAVSPDNSTAFVAMEGNDTVVPVDLVAGAAGTPIQVPPHPAWLALTPDASTLFVTHVALGPTGLGEPAPANVTPIDVAARTVRPDIDLGSQTTGVVITPDGSTAYVNVLADVDTQAAVVPIDVATLTAGTPISVPGQPYALALRPQPSIDTTPPTVTLETTPASPTGGGGTWFNAEDLDGGSPTVNALGLDPPNGLGGSGVTEVRCLVDGSIHAAVGDELTLTLGAGTHSVSCSAQDTSGNVTDPPVQATYRVDTHAPDFAGAVTGSGPTGAVLLNDPAAVAHANADDGTGSGVASSSCGTPDVSTVGRHTVSCSATDVAGNTSTADVTYVVEYALVGLSPADGTSVRAGKPVKIAVSLADASGAPAALCAGCSIEVQIFAGDGSGPFAMTYHNGSGEYRSSWKPPSGPATASIVVSVRYPGTAVATTAAAVVTIT